MLRPGGLRKTLKKNETEFKITAHQHLAETNK